MVPEARHSVAVLTRLRQEVSEDREAMSKRLAELDDATSRVDEVPWASHAAVALHGWYTALESALERVVRTLDGDVPRGDRWHRDLLSQVTVEVPGLRPAVLPRALLPELLELLGFRHFFRHAYGVAFEPEKLRVEVERVRRLAPGVERALDLLDEHLEATIDSLTSG